MYADVDYFFNFIFAFLASLTRLIMMLVYELQPKPYMDEIFHIPQVQAYCNNSFTTWDPMITTLPGLYLFSLGILKPLEYMFKSNFCQTYYLRIINVGFCIGVYYISTMIALRMRTTKAQNSKLATLTGLSTSIFPILYFFNFLYYTDVGSTFFVLFAYLLNLHDLHKSSAFMGAMSIMFRQTNVVWVVFMGWLAGCPAMCGAKKIGDGRSNGRSEPDRFNDFMLNLKSILKSATKSNFKPLVGFVSGVLGSVWPYCVVVIAFGGFFVYNGGIVLGAKSDHEAGLHLCQILYFAAFSFAFLLPVLPLTKIIHQVLKFCKDKVKFALVAMLAILIVIHFTTTTHRYLLSDNRHYTFYIWKNLFQKHITVRYLLSPVYFLSIFALWTSIRSVDFLWKLGFFVCLVAALAPASLLEFRYFIIPFLLLRLNVEMQPGAVRAVLELLLYSLVNSVTIYVFLYKTFLWPGSEELQRFMY